MPIIIEAMDLNLTKRGQYVVRAAIALARADDDEYLKTSEIASSMQLPGLYAPQVLLLLRKSGLSESKPGKDGGHRLTRPPEEISLLDIVNAAGEDVRESECILRAGPCPGESECSLHLPWERAQRAMISILQSTSLQDLADIEGA